MALRDACQFRTLPSASHAVVSGEMAKALTRQASRTWARHTLPAQAETEKVTTMQNRVFVIDSRKTPLMPCHPARARDLLRAGKAAVFRRFPFTIILRERFDGDR